MFGGVATKLFEASLAQNGGDVDAAISAVPGTIRGSIDGGTIARARELVQKAGAHVAAAGAGAAVQQHMESQAKTSLTDIAQKVGPIVLGAAFGAAGGAAFGTAGRGVATTGLKLVTAPSAPRLAPPPPPPRPTMFDTTSQSTGDLVLGGLNQYLQYRLQERAMSQSLPMAMPGAPQVTSVAWPLPAIGAAAGGLAARMLPQVVGAGARAVGGRLISAAGKYVTRRNAVALAKQLGIQGAATALGIGALELAQMVVDDQARKRRGGGITAAQMRTTRKTMRKVVGLHRQLVQACSSAGVRRRSARSCPPPKVIVARK